MYWIGDLLGEITKSVYWLHTGFEHICLALRISWLWRLIGVIFWLCSNYSFPAQGLPVPYEVLAFINTYTQVNISNILRRLLVFFQMDQLLGNMIEMWVDRMDNITQPERRKLSALALLSLLPSDNRWGNVFLKFISLKIKVSALFLVIVTAVCCGAVLF